MISIQKTGEIPSNYKLHALTGCPKCTITKVILMMVKITKYTYLEKIWKLRDLEDNNHSPEHNSNRSKLKC